MAYMFMLRLSLSMLSMRSFSFNALMSCVGCSLVRTAHIWPGMIAQILCALRVARLICGIFRIQAAAKKAVSRIGVHAFCVIYRIRTANAALKMKMCYSIKLIFRYIFQKSVYIPP